MREIKKLAIVLGCALLFIVFYFLCAGSAKSAKEYYASGGGGTTDVENFQNVSIEDDIHRYVVKIWKRKLKSQAPGILCFTIIKWNGPMTVRKESLISRRAFSI